MALLRLPMTFTFVGYIPVLARISVRLFPLFLTFTPFNFILEKLVTVTSGLALVDPSGYWQVIGTKYLTLQPLLLHKLRAMALLLSQYRGILFEQKVICLLAGASHHKGFEHSIQNLQCISASVDEMEGILCFFDDQLTNLSQESYALPDALACIFCTHALQRNYMVGSILAVRTQERGYCTNVIIKRVIFGPSSEMIWVSVGLKVARTGDGASPELIYPGVIMIGSGPETDGTGAIV
ncbi:hypothetical protein Tco_0457919 [Tanacetum coccineum]